MSIMKVFSTSLAILLSVNRNMLARGNSVLYGTNNGYDVGGDEPVCFLSEFGVPQTSSQNRTDFGSDPIRNGPSSFYDILEKGSSVESEGDVASIQAASQLIAELDDALFYQRLDLNRKVELLDACYNGTNVQVRALDLGANSSMYRGFPYSFRISLGMSATDILSSTNSSFITGVFFRLALCDALKAGYCNPVVANATDNNPTVVVVSNSSNHTLVGKVDRKRKMVFSPWVLPLTTYKSDPNQITLKPLDVRFQVPKATPAGVYRFVAHVLLVLLEHGATSEVKRLDMAAKGEVSCLECLLS